MYTLDAVYQKGGLLQWGSREQSLSQASGRLFWCPALDLSLTATFISVSELDSRQLKSFETDAIERLLWLRMLLREVLIFCRSVQ